jgi:16S rRNA U516 pseudouridylate synthase RsuA-like enzyme
VVPILLIAIAEAHNSRARSYMDEQRNRKVSRMTGKQGHETKGLFNIAGIPEYFSDASI